MSGNICLPNIIRTRRVIQIRSDIDLNLIVLPIVSKMCVRVSNIICNDGVK